MKTAAEIIKQAEAQWEQLEKLKQWAINFKAGKK
jgi:hypothetical protein